MTVAPAVPRPRPDSPADSDLVRAARGLPVSRTPVWFMRQAGRSLPEYRALRAGTAMLEACQDPDLVTEITLQPVRRHGVDAAILFSDIVLPLVVAGVDIEIKPGVGPVVAQPCARSPTSTRCRRSSPSGWPSCRRRSGCWCRAGPTPLIGFAGAPFTLATYLIEGGPSKEHAAHQGLHVRRAGGLDAAAGPAGLSAATFLRAQVDAGASAVQLFDSWAGVLSAADYERGCCRTRARSSTGSATGTCRGSTSASAPVSCCR